LGINLEVDLQDVGYARADIRPISSLPSLDDAIAFAKAVARVLSEITGEPYGEPALSECVLARR
jgi:hypothetical protein